MEGTRSRLAAAAAAVVVVVSVAPTTRAPLFLLTLVLQYPGALLAALSVLAAFERERTEAPAAAHVVSADILFTSCSVWMC